MAVPRLKFRSRGNRLAPALEPVALDGAEHSGIWIAKNRASVVVWTRSASTGKLRQ